MHITAKKLAHCTIGAALVVALVLSASVATATDVGDRRPTDPQIAWLLTRFITQVRGVPADSFVLSQNFLDAYHYATDQGAVALNEYARDNDPYAKMIGRAQVEVDVSSVTRTSDDNFRIAWIERHYSQGSLAESEHWDAQLTVLVRTPSLEEKTNPLGIYVRGIDWSRQID
jgi:type IV secretory pathway TrbF-like protein